MSRSSARLRTRRSMVGVAAAGCVVATTALLPVSPAGAALAPDTPLSGRASSVYQTNGRVEALDVSGGIVYAGGNFSAVRPPTGTAGSTLTRRFLVALNAGTGVPTSFAPTLNGVVYDVDVSPDGRTLYVAGDFTTVNGSTRNHFAAFNLGTGALTGWNPDATGGNGHAVTASGTRVYLGGTFSRVGGTAHAALASVDTGTGALDQAFTATADAQVTRMTLTADGSNRLIVAGNFDTIAGRSEHALVSLSPTTGAVQTWAGNSALPNEAGTDPNNPFSGCTALGAEVLEYQGTVYVASDGLQPGCFDGDEAITTGGSPTATGTIRWVNPCEGATIAIAVLNNTLYKGSHMHDCGHSPGGPGGGFVGSFDRNNREGYNLVGQSLTTGSFVHWHPDTNGGAPGFKGPYAMATDGSQLFVGGEFTQVNGVAQQGLTRFRPTAQSGSAAPIAPTAAPTAVVTGVGAVSVSVPATSDPDSGTLTYQLYRGTTQVGIGQMESWPWAGPTLRFQVAAPSGSASTFRYRVTDGTSTSAFSPVSSAVTPSAANAPGGYVATVTGQSPRVWWRLAGNGADASGNGATGTLTGGTSSTAGAVPGDAALALNGSTGYVTSAAAAALPGAFTQSVWFKTSTLRGGALVGRSLRRTGADPAADRVMWLDNSGVVAFAMQSQPAPNAPPGPPNVTLRSNRSAYNDGRWHQAVGTFDGTTMTLYVDGARMSTQTAQASAGSGAYYYRAGYVDLSGLSAVFGTNTTDATAPNSYFLNGAIDEVGFYGTALSAAQVAAQYRSVVGTLD